MSTTLSTLKPISSADLAFLFDLYADTRREEMNQWGWPAEQRDTFLKMQFTAQRSSYQSAFPRAQHSMILLKDQPIGALLINRSDAEIRIVDIALRAEFRGTGIGGGFVGELIREAAATNKVLRLQVAKINRALRLYQRLGFVVIGDDGVYVAMEWRPQ